MSRSQRLWSVISGPVSRPLPTAWAAIGRLRQPPGSSARKVEEGREHRQDGAEADEEPGADGLPQCAWRLAYHHKGEAGRDPRQ